MGNFSNNLRWRLASFMQGRYGNDQLNIFLSIGCLVLLLVCTFTHWTVLWVVALAMLALSIFRCYSKNIGARSRENEAWMRIIAKPAKSISTARTRWSKRKTTLYFKCPGCKTTLSVPKGKGRLKITCPKCGAETFRKS